MHSERSLETNNYLVQAVDAIDDSPAVPEHTTVETPMNMSPENKAYFLAEKEAIHMILTGIGDDIYSTVDACQTAQEMWEVIERFYKLMNEMIRNNLTVTTMQINVQFLQQLQPNWSRFVMTIKQQHKLDEVSYHKLFDLMKQYQNEVNELRAERLARNANPLALVATTQANQDQYYRTSRDKDMQKNLALIAKYFKKIYKPINNNLRTSSKYKNKNVDTNPRFMNENHSGQFGNQRTVNVAGAREKSRKSGKQYDWLAHTDEVDEQELEARYSYMAKIQEDDIQNDQNDVESDDERVALANLIATLKFNTKQTEFEKYKAFNDVQLTMTNLNDMKTNLFWEFGKFTSHDGESMESYYTRFYKLMNEMIRNNLTVTTMQINVQFLQQLQPKWSRFVMTIKQQHKLDEVSYHKLFDIMKQYQNEVNELRAERLARNANPLALVATTQANQDQYYRTSRDKDMQKNLALIAKYFKKIYKPINNNLRTSSNYKNKNVDTTPRFKNENQSGQFGNQRTVNVAGAREKSRKKPKRVKDSTYHKEKMLLCKQAEQGVPLQAEQYDWLAHTDEVDEKELEARYSYMAKIQEVPTADSGIDSEPVE
nr:hypothetical protein [Tanacetum cinerariifolium]